MAQWSSGETGILRKNKPKDNHDDLLVFGYACKLFRDDEKALFIDQGKHLIPWMGEDSLKIDRYDCRGALSDLLPYEASREGFDAMRWLGLSEAEHKLERLCDRERYYSLHINEEDELMYKEEEKKRQKANEFQYSYDVQQEPSQNVPVLVEEEEDEKFVPSPNLDVPIDITIPKTVKENTRIEKTALFVFKQGPQMEILIKAKQSDNPQFGFLNQNNPLYKYYRHVLNAIKLGRYEVKSTKDEDNQKPDETEQNDHYLHPSLLSTTTPFTTTTTTPQNMTKHSEPIVPHPSGISYKPSTNCSYSQLVNRIQGNAHHTIDIALGCNSGINNNKNINNQNELNTINQQQLTYEQQQYYQYYYAAQYYEYYKQMAQYQQQNGGQSQELDPNIQQYIHQMAYSQVLQQQQQQQPPKPQPTNPYAQIVSNVSSLLPENINNEIKLKNEEIKKPLLSLAQYGSDESDEEKNEMIDNTKTILIPNGEIQIVIDKMASYVAKNGEQFEEIVKAKGDPRFEFLNVNHQFYLYYRNKIKQYKMKNDECNKNINENNQKIENNNELTQKCSKEKKVITPVCFSIKKPKDDQPKEIKSALPIEESDEDDNNELTTITSTSNDEKSTINHDNVETKMPQQQEFEDDPLLEMIDLTEELEEKKGARRAEDKIKDKLAAAAREKLASVARDRALQIERKKKAAAFLKLKAETTTTSSTSSSSDISKSDVTKTDESSNCNDHDDNEDNLKKSKKRKSHKRKHSSKTSKHDRSNRKKAKKKGSRSKSTDSSISSNS